MTNNSAEFQPASDNVFARIAENYDRYCDYFSFYIQRLWKRAFAAQLIEETGTIWLDLASGTGDIPIRVLRRRSDIHVVASDICPEMLAVARRKMAHTAATDFALVDACDMTNVASESCDMVSMAFGMKIIDRHRASAEILRVLKPGGVFLCIEASRIPLTWLQSLYLGYMQLCLPAIGYFVAKGDRAAYGYLLKGIHLFPGAADLAEELRSTGFDAVSFRRLSLGIVAIHRAVKSAP